MLSWFIIDRMKNIWRPDLVDRNGGTHAALAHVDDSGDPGVASCTSDGAGSPGDGEIKGSL